MKNSEIDWGYLLGRLMVDTAHYDAPGAFAVDENGCLVEDCWDDEEDGSWQANAVYPLCGDPAQADDAQELLL